MISGLAFYGLTGHHFGDSLGNCVAFGASGTGFLTKLKLHGLDGSLELEGEFLALGEGLAELANFFFQLFQLGGKVFLESGGFHT